MAHHQLSQQKKIKRVLNSQAAGATAITETFSNEGATDLSVIVAFGAIVSGAVTSVKLQQGDASDGSDAVDITGCTLTVADTDDNKLSILEVARLTCKYTTIVISRATENATVDSVIAVLEQRYKPAANDTTVQGQVAVAAI